MVHQLPALPFSLDALAPFISKETLDYHYGKHHAAYVANLNKLIPGTEFENLSLEEIVKKAPAGGIFNNAAQIFNHTFYWHCLAPKKGGVPSGAVQEVVEEGFGSFGKFKEMFTAAAVTQFGSGWAWLVKDDNGKLTIEAMSNAGTPLKDNKKPLLVCDVWEHAYYIDYRNNRAGYVDAFWNLVNWDFVEQNLALELSAVSSDFML
jgi:Fe-Mn family superoxide dismutase